MLRRTQFSLTAVTLALLGLPRPLRSKDPKLKPEELVARHLQSLGSAEALAKVQSRALNATVVTTTQFGRAGALPGKASIFSKGPQTRVGIVIDAPDYPGEQFAFDGAKVTAASLLPGVRSPLGAFVYQNGVLMREGLIGGVLTTAWPLLNLETRRPLL